MNEDIQRPAATAASALLRQVRDDAALTQTEWAERAGVAPSTVSAYESGLRAPSLAAIDRLLAAVGKQLHLVAESLAADLDAAIDAAQATPVPQRLERNAGSLDRIIERLTSVPYVIEGALAALLQGAPVPVEALEIVVARADLGLLAKALERMYARRWSNKWRQFGYEITDPREEGEPRWITLYGEIRLRAVDELPAAIEIRVSELCLAVRPLVDLETSDPGVRRILARIRQRIGSAA